jgi:hypothetical protein
MARLEEAIIGAAGRQNKSAILGASKLSNYALVLLESFLRNSSNPPVNPLTACVIVTIELNGSIRH